MVLDTFIYVIHIIICVCIVALVIVQHGKGADAGAAFGSGASGTVFGAAGKSNFLAKTTKWLVVMFFATSLTMMFYSGRVRTTGTSVTDTISAVTEVPTSINTNASDVPASKPDQINPERKAEEQ